MGWQTLRYAASATRNNLLGGAGAERPMGGGAGASTSQKQSNVSRLEGGEAHRREAAKCNAKLKRLSVNNAAAKQKSKPHLLFRTSADSLELLGACHLAAR